jgi:glycosyltransferase involved in cell wall biosynthesis
VRTVQARGGEVLTLTTTDRDVIEDPAVRRYSSIPFWAYPQLRLAAPGRSAVMRELRDFEPTLVHAATPFGVGLAGRAAARRLGVPFVSSYHTSFSAYAEFYGLGSLAAPGWRYLRWFQTAGCARTARPAPCRMSWRCTDCRTRVSGGAVLTLPASPHATATFGNVLLEAMASGVPVVAADAAPTRELLRGGDSGVLVGTSGPMPMARAILRLAGDAQRRDALATSGLATAAQHAWDAVFDLLLQDYADVASPARHEELVSILKRSLAGRRTGELAGCAVAPDSIRPGGASRPVGGRAGPPNRAAIR